MIPDTSALVVPLLALVVASALATALARDLLVATVVFAAYSVGLALLWLAFRAPDVGLTEAAVGAGVTTALFLAAAARTGASTGGRSFAVDRYGRGAAVGLLVAGSLGATVGALPAVGATDAPAAGGTAAAAYYLDATPRLGVDNAVTAVLVVFRGFDTFGEIAVVFAAAVAVLAVAEREGS